MLKLPYAVSEFEKIIEGNYVYLDRTHHIPSIEDWGHQILFLRPRRFGKSLWISVLMDYYNIAKADDFERLFGHLAIGQNPTPLHNQYLVMRWDFSKIESHSSIEQIEKILHERANQWINIFQQEYREWLDHPVVINSENALVSFESLINTIRLSGHKLYLFIDEYDNFANEVMMSIRGDNYQRYDELVTDEGMFKTFFKNIKSFGSGEGLDRVFITGVSPIIMNDVTSGANVFESIYWFQEYNDLCGFWENEVADMLAQVIEERGLPQPERAAKQEEALEMMRSYYDGSWFTMETPPPDKLSTTDATNSRLYNPTLVFYFLRYLQRTGKYPAQMLDINLRADRGKLTYLVHYDMGRELLVDIFNQEPETSVVEIGTEFGADEMLQDNMRQERLASLLCYLGALTINGTAANGNILLTIPNLVMKNLYAERIQEMMFKRDMSKFKAIQQVVDILFYHGQLEPLCNFLEESYMSIYSNRDYPQFKELSLKSLFIALLYHNNLYTIYSEPEFTRRYGDIYMELKPDKWQSIFFNLLFEFKQLALKELIPAPDSAKKRQRRKPLTEDEVKAKTRDELLLIPAVKDALDGAKTQLHNYQQILYKRYGTDFKLRSYAVVGVGLGKVVFEKVH